MVDWVNPNEQPSLNKEFTYLLTNHGARSGDIIGTEVLLHIEILHR